MRILTPAQPVRNFRLANSNSTGLPGFRIVSFDHVVTGVRRFCLCHKTAHDKMLSAATKRVTHYAPQSWPHRVIDTLEGAIYAEGLCHFCISRQYGEDIMKSWYGNSVQTHYGPYVDLLTNDGGVDVRTAKAEAKRRLSINRWVREEELYQLICRIFPAQTIMREASPHWLGLQRLDIYLPDLSLAIEHQGEQHFQPVDGFGGEKAFAKVQERDDRKRNLCLENGVSLVEIRFDDHMTIPSLRSRFRRWLPRQ